MHVQTTHGKRYHTPGCRYIIGKVTSICNSDLDPCQICCHDNISQNKNKEPIDDFANMHEVVQRVDVQTDTTSTFKFLENSSNISRILNDIEFSMKFTLNIRRFFTKTSDGTFRPSTRLETRIKELRNAQSLNDLQYYGCYSIWNLYSSEEDILNTITPNLARDVAACSIICFQEWIKQNGLDPQLINKVYQGFATMKWKDIPLPHQKKENKKEDSEAASPPDAHMTQISGEFLAINEKKFKISIQYDADHPIWSAIHEILHFLAWHPERSIGSTGFIIDNKQVKRQHPEYASENLNEGCNDWLTESVLKAWHNDTGESIFPTHDIMIQLSDDYYGQRRVFDTIGQRIPIQEIIGDYLDNRPDRFANRLQQVSQSPFPLGKIDLLLDMAIDDEKQENYTNRDKIRKHAVLVSEVSKILNGQE